MKVWHTVAEFRAWRRRMKGTGVTPFVPTMGALHEGHGELVRRARQKVGEGEGTERGDRGGVMASIFVNPTQFGPNEDFAKYPRTLEADCRLLEAAGCDAVFVPSAEEMYGAEVKGQKSGGEKIAVDAGRLGTVLEGAIRPGHFRGVCTVVLKLLNIVEPSHLLLGQKDYQQLAVVRQMVADLNVPVEVLGCPTVREADGLAMSSRNRYLNADERARAVALFEALTWAKGAYEGGERESRVLDAGMEERLVARGLVVQYALAAHAETLVAFRESGGRAEAPAVLLIAAKLGATRLIDNMLCKTG